MSLVEAAQALPGLRDLPVAEALPRLAEALASSKVAALEAPPGSGKTVLAPLWLQQKAGFRRVLVLVPRRVNARLPVLFLEPACGPAVGYRIRFESRWDEARIKVGYLTYGTALRTLAEDPPDQDDLVIFDEFHERPWEADLLLAYLRHSAAQGRGPRLLIMSATLDGAALPDGTPVVKSDGRLHPVELTWESSDPMLLARPQGLAELVARRSAELARRAPGEQLIFLPGLSQIRAVQTLLQGGSQGGPVDILHSSLPEAEIRRVVERPVGAGFRRILSTDLAESSVTLPGVTTVLDAGLRRRPRRDAFGLGISLETVRAPLSSLTQRAGRAGRLRPGCCHRLMTRQDELHRAAFGQPEISEIDGKSLALHLASLRLLHLWPELEWLARPQELELRCAEAWLAEHGLLEGEHLSERGRRVLRSTCSPRAGLFGVLAAESGWPAQQIVDWVYAMENGPGREIRSRALTDLLGDKSWMAARESRLLHRLRDVFSRPGTSQGSPPLLGAFADTLVELRGDRALPMVEGVEALAYRGSEKSGSGYAVLLGTAPGGPRDGPTSLVTLYQPVPVEDIWEGLLEEMQERTSLEWDARLRAVRAVRRTTLGALVLEEEAVHPAPGPEVAELLLRHISDSEVADGLGGLVRRLELFLEARADIRQELQAHLPEDPSLSRALVRSYLQTVTRWSKDLPEQLREHARGLIGYSHLRALDAALPPQVQLPGRARPVAVHYPEHGAPYVASKLQDFFGWKPPRLLDGRIPLACHLLAPSGRPVQITEDLEGFWKGSYQQVRKDLRGRYPKHAWPEDPSQA